MDGLSTRNYVVVLGDLNARVGDGEVEGVVGKYGAPGENESGERLLDMCVEQELVIGNSFFKKKEINKYTWIRVANGRVIERALMDYVLITKRMVGRLKDVHVSRGVAAGMSRVVKKTVFFISCFFREKNMFFSCFFLFFSFFFSLHPISSFLKTLLIITVNL